MPSPARQHPLSTVQPSKLPAQHPGPAWCCPARAEKAVSAALGPSLLPQALVCIHHGQARALSTPPSKEPSHFLFSCSQIYLQHAAIPEKKKALIPSKVFSFNLRSECAW